VPTVDEQHAMLRSAFTLDVFQFVSEIAEGKLECAALVHVRAQGLIALLRGDGPIGQAFRAALERPRPAPFAFFLRVEVDGAWVRKDLRDAPPAAVAAWVRDKTAEDPEFAVRLVLMLLGHEVA
jgi:hypothetical protein